MKPKTIRDLPLTPLALGRFAKVDVSDYPKVSQHSWQLFMQENRAYARRKFDGKYVFLHRFLLGELPKYMDIDHINGDGLDCRRSNLRVCTRKQNMANMRKHKGSSKYKGVSLTKSRNKFQAAIMVSGKSIYLGFFDSEVDAAIAYDIAAKRYFGDFAWLNSEHFKEIKERMIDAR